VARVHAEDEGCELYALHENDDRFVMLEKWASPEALAAHARSPAFAELASRLEGKLDAELDVQVLQPRPAGTAGRGLLLAGRNPAGPGRGTALVNSGWRAAHRACPFLSSRAARHSRTANSRSKRELWSSSRGPSSSRMTLIRYFTVDG